LISSSQTSETKTNIASSFELSISRSRAEVFAQDVDGPPKKFKLPKQDLQYKNTEELGHSKV
jgi:hypothetical protein